MIQNDNWGVRVFHFDRGLKLTRADLAIDFTRRQPRAFISHAHRDHMARHEYALCTPETSKLYHERLGRRRTREMPYLRPIEFGGLRLTAYPAGHCLGSAMLLADDGSQSLLYTGDFKLGPSATCQTAEFPRADVLVMESTFGHPAYRMVARQTAVCQMLDVVQRILAAGKTPVIHAYVLGKAQEVTKILTDAGIPVLQHPSIYAISTIYGSCGVDLGDYRLYPGECDPGHAVVVPPRRANRYRLPNLGAVETIAVTGWAMDQHAGKRLGVDHPIALSDHADFPQLMEAVQRVEPRRVYCTHGPRRSIEALVAHLRQLGVEAFPLGQTYQMRLF